MIRGIMWFLIWICAIVYCIGSIVNSLQLYFQFPITTVTKPCENLTGHHFPKIRICANSMHSQIGVPILDV